MKIKAWKMAGLVMALLGAMTMTGFARGGGGGGGGGGGQGQKKGGDKQGERAALREERIKEFDKDGDGKLNEEERAAFREDRIKEFDKDGDGKLNEEERAAMRKQRQERRQQRTKQSE